MEFSIFVSVHHSTTNPSSLRPTKAALGVYLSHRRVLSTFYFVAHVRISFGL